MTFRQKKLTPKIHPFQGVKRPQNPAFRVKKSKNIDSASKNGPNLMYDGLLEAYGLAR